MPLHRLQIVALCFFLSPLYAKASSLIENFSASGLSQAVWEQTMGYDFTVAGSPILVTSLGFYARNDFSSSGLATAHQVGLWTISGTLLSSVTFPAGTATPNDFVYMTLSIPVLLASGSSYVVGVNYSPGLRSDEFYGSGISSVSGNSAITIGKKRNDLMNGFAFPGNVSNSLPAIGPNAQFSVIPEPSVSILLGLAFVVVISRRHFL